MLKLILLRHGKAENQKADQEDYDRRLNRKGVVQINQMGQLLSVREKGIDQIISSSAKRTAETTEIANHYLKVKQVDYSKDLYLASEDDILTHLSREAKSERVLYVGHNFGISTIASLFAGQSLSMTTGMMIVLEFETDDWSEVKYGDGKLVSVQAPNVYLP